MMHRFKRALHVDDQQKLLAASDRLKAVDIELRRLLQQYPALQKNLEETERAWTTLTYSVRATALSFRDADTGTHTDAESRQLESACDALINAGEKLPCPRGCRPAVALKSYCDQLRKLRVAHSTAVDALRERQYYQRKMNELDKARGGDSSHLTQRKTRNRRKLTEAEADVEVRTEAVEQGLSDILQRRAAVCAATMALYVQQQVKCFDAGDALRKVPHFIPDVDDSDLRMLSQASGASSRSPPQTPSVSDRQDREEDPDASDYEEPLDRFYSTKDHEFDRFYSSN